MPAMALRTDPRTEPDHDMLTRLNRDYIASVHNSTSRASTALTIALVVTGVVAPDCSLSGRTRPPVTAPAAEGCKH